MNYKAPEHNSLDGQVIECNGKRYKLSANNTVVYPVSIPMPTYNLNPTMSFDTEDGELVLRIKPNPVPVVSGYDQTGKKR